MMKTFHIKLLFTLLLCSSLKIVAQNTNNPKASIKISPSNPRPLLKYLFNTYGIENSEQILLDIQDYETNNNVKVLYKDQYYEEIDLIEATLATTKLKVEFVRLTESKTKLINFSQIETIIISH